MPVLLAELGEVTLETAVGYSGLGVVLFLLGTVGLSLGGLGRTLLVVAIELEAGRLEELVLYVKRVEVHLEVVGVLDEGAGVAEEALEVRVLVADLLEGHLALEPTYHLGVPDVLDQVQELLLDDHQVSVGELGEEGGVPVLVEPDDLLVSHALLFRDGQLVLALLQLLARLMQTRFLLV